MPLGPMEPDPSNAPDSIRKAKVADPPAGDQTGSPQPPDGGVPSPPQTQQEPTVHRTQRIDFSQEHSPFVDPLDPNVSELAKPAQQEPAAPKPPTEKKTAEPPPIDLGTLGSETYATVQKRAEGQTQADFAALYNRRAQMEAELNAIPHATREQVEELPVEQRARLDQLSGSIREIDNDLGQRLPVVHGTRMQSGNVMASQIVSLQRQAAADHPDLASRVLDIAKNLPPEQQANPMTYQILANQVLGEQEQSKRQRESMSRAASMAGVAGGRSGGSEMPHREVSSQEVDRLRRMGVKGKFLNRAIERLEEQG